MSDKYRKKAAKRGFLPWGFSSPNPISRKLNTWLKLASGEWWYKRK